jgi:phosphoglycerate dehydrogenase-like enzyme
LSDNFVNAARLALMKPTALLVDISRVGIVNRQDLANALGAGKLAGAAIDLCDPLPVGMTDPILDAPRTVLTPHMAWQTRETFHRAATISVENILNYFSGEPKTLAILTRSKFPARDFGYLCKVDYSSSHEMRAFSHMPDGRLL